MGLKRSERRWLGTSDPYARLRKIETLDPETDHREITELFYFDFQSVMLVQGVSGFLFTFAAPRMSRILAASGQVEQHTAKRYVDTALLTGSVMQHGLEPGEGREAARRVNAMHRQYDIHADDFIAVGCEVPITSLDLADRFGWRPVSEVEREAVRIHYSKEARAFGSHKPLPDTLDGMKAFWQNYLDTELAFELQNKTLSDSLLRFTPTLAPRIIRPLMNPLMTAQVDPRILKACGLSTPSRLRKRLSSAAMRAIGKSDPKPDTSGPIKNPVEALAAKVYPHGWSIQTLGTHLRSHSDLA